MTKGKIKLNCFHMNYFHKRSWRVYENKLKTTYVHAISCFHKLTQAITQVFMLVDKLK